ncbi:MAG: hypothetical protein ACRC1M_03970 [Methanobacteriaceae archaeon]
MLRSGGPYGPLKLKQNQIRAVRSINPDIINEMVADGRLKKLPELSTLKRPKKV